MKAVDKVKSYVDSLDDESQTLAIKAIKDLLAEGRDYEWILAALTCKTKEDWELWGFGLMWNWNFIAQVDSKMKFRNEARENLQKESVKEFWDKAIEEWS